MTDLQPKLSRHAWPTPIGGLTAVKISALKVLCRGCPRRFQCAKDALDTPGIQGTVAAVYVPKEGRARTFALRQLQSLAAYAGLAGQPEIPG